MKRILLTIALMWLVACSGKQTPDDGAMSDSQYTEAMEKEHGADSTKPSGAEAQAMGEFKTSGKPIEYGTVDGKPVKGFIAGPTTGPPPTSAIIMIHEWWGLNSNVMEMATMFASHGYIVLAVDMYGGEFASQPEDAKRLMTAAMEKPELGVANLEAARAFLAAEGATKIGVLGWCFGGMWALEAGLAQGDDLDAIVLYYGRVKTTPEEVAALEAPLLGIFASEDQGIPVEQVKQFEAALQTAQKNATIHIYDGVDHAFANPSGDRYNEEAADDAWIKVLAFLDTHL